MQASAGSQHGAGGAPASGGAVRRLRRELELLRRSQNPQIAVRPSESTLLEWHFALHSLPPDTPYSGGCYHGRLIFPPQYPHAPPSVVMVTPSGRLETGCRLCLSMTDFHPESWNPAWSVETILVGLVSFFLSDRESGFGALHEPAERRRALAAASRAANARSPEFASLFPEFLGAAAAASGAPAEASGAPAEASGAAGGGGGCGAGGEGAAAAPPECWICREASGAPLIHPCACRGSMGGVHAECVERWLRHRRAGGAHDRPRCSVCRMPFAGREVRPGLASFARSQLQDAAGQLGRSAALIFLLMGFQDASQGDRGSMPRALRALFAGAFWAICACRFAVLAASLPMYRAPPRDPRMRRLHVSDPQILRRHVAESLAVVAVLGLWCARGELPPPAFLPFAAAALALAWRHSGRRPVPALLALVLLPLRALARLPAALAGGAARLLCWPPWPLLQWLHPLGGGPHVLAAGAAVALCLRGASRAPVLALWALHSCLLLAGLVERLALRRLRWRCGQAWWHAAQLAALGAYVANVLSDFPRGTGTPGGTWALVLGASTVWLTAVCTSAAAANWPQCVRQYRAWQRQHSSFTLVAPRTQVVPVVPPV